MRRAWIIPLLAFASVTGAMAAPTFDVHLIEPAEHADLVAGSTVSIAWEATNAPANVEEWEAFLSIDGGRTYPIRLTPHLDLAIRRFAWTVPFVPAAEASILLRFGDERDEREFAFPARIEINGAMPLDFFRCAVFTETLLAGSEEDDHGEKLVEWVEGPRDGSRIHQVFASVPILADGDQWTAPPDDAAASAASSDSNRLDPALLQLLVRRDPALSRLLDVQVSRPRTADVLALTGRLNI
jgi:hypothetical protein